GALSRELDWAAVDEYFRHGYIASPRTIFTSIKKLPPASYLVCSLDGGEPRIARYWDLKFTQGPAMAEADWIDRLGALLDESVRLHMVADVPIGAFLSVWLDLSSYVVHMELFSRQPMRKFSSGSD